MRRTAGFMLRGLLVATVVLTFAAPASAVPAFARRYGMSCTTCHDAWPHLNAAGWSFKMSGYRRLNGRDLEPTVQDIQLAQGALSMPAIPPLALTVSAGFDWRRDVRRGADGTRATQTGSSIDLENANLFVAAPLGQHLSAFAEFPMFETHAEALDGPTGPGEANSTDRDSRRAIQFDTESPVFEMGKITWNSLFPTTLFPVDSVNLLIGSYQLPTAYSAEANRMSINPYLIYRRRAVDLLSPTPTGNLLVGNEGDRLLRLGEPQIQFAINGVLVPFGPITDLGKVEALALEYDLGVTNGSNNNSDPNTQKDFFGRLSARWFGQTIGVFGYWSPDIYDDFQREDGSTTVNPVGIFSGSQLKNRFTSVGPDLTLSLLPLNVPVWLENQVLFNRESDPTGFRKSFEWWGGFSQLNVQPLKQVIAYARYDWIHGDKFDDTPLGGVTGPVKPREWAAVVGLQWFVLENLKVATEYSRREFQNRATAPHELVQEDFFSVRATVGF